MRGGGSAEPFPAHVLQPGAAPRSARLRFARKSPGSGSHVLGQVGLSPCVLALPVLWIVEKFGDVAPWGGEDPKARSRCGSVTLRLPDSAVLGGVGNASTESLSPSEGKEGESGIAAGLFLGWAAGAAPSARCLQRCRPLPGAALRSPPGVVPLANLPQNMEEHPWGGESPAVGLKAVFAQLAHLV